MKIKFYANSIWLLQKQNNFRIFDYIMNKEKYMMRLNFFENFSKIELQRVLVNNSQIMLFEKGDVILKKGEISAAVFIILSGNVLIVTDYKIITTLTEGMFFGEISFLTKEPRTANALSNDECIIMRIDDAIMEYLHINIREKIKDKIIQKLIINLKEMNEKLDTLK